MSLFSASLAGRQETTEPLKSTTNSAAVTTTAPPDSRTPTQDASVKPSAIPPTTAQSERDTPTYFPASISLSTSSSLFDDDSQYSESHFLLAWKIGIIVPFAVVIFILFPWFIIRQLRRPRFRPSPGNVDLLAHSRDLARRGRGRSGRRSPRRGRLERWLTFYRLIAYMTTHMGRRTFLVLRASPTHHQRITSTLPINESVPRQHTGHAQSHCSKPTHKHEFLPQGCQRSDLC